MFTFVDTCFASRTRRLQLSTFGIVRDGRKPAVLVVVNLMKLYNQWKLRMISVNGKEKEKQREIGYSPSSSMSSQTSVSFHWYLIGLPANIVFSVRRAAAAEVATVVGCQKTFARSVRVFSLSNTSTDRIHQDFLLLLLSFSLFLRGLVQRGKVTTERRKQRCRMMRTRENHSARAELLVIDVVLCNWRYLRVNIFNDTQLEFFGRVSLRHWLSCSTDPTVRQKQTSVLSLGSEEE